MQKTDTVHSPLLQMCGIHKSFGGIHALTDVSFDAYAGEVHALIGENGAGKSTLMKVLSGACRADSGRLLLTGTPMKVRSPAEARRHGIAMIYQELTVAPQLTVYDNILLGMEQHTLGFLQPRRKHVYEILERLGHGSLDIDTPASALGIAEQQIIEIARALMFSASIIVFDEPTSSLSTADTEILFNVIHRLKQEGVAIIYISHFLEEIQQVADRFTVLRDGRVTGTGIIRTTSLSDIITMMVGRTLHEMFPRIPHTIGEPVFNVRDVSGTILPENASLTLHCGEILGIGGLVGSGRSELLRTLFGLHKARSGTVSFESASERTIQHMTPARSLKLGCDLLSENRKEEGLALDMSIRNNVTLATLPRYSRKGGLIHIAHETNAARKYCHTLNLKFSNVYQPVRDLSGGNQQKAALARLLANGNRILLLDEPTRGIDVGSKVEIYRLIGILASQGNSIIMVSSYLPELLGICDNMAVMYRGRLSAVKPVQDWTHEQIMHYATSGKYGDTL
jgi:ribose transport system ATP-binding protein